MLGATVADKFLFTGTLHVPVTAKIVIFVTVLISMATPFMPVRQSMKRGMMPAASPDNPMGQSQKYMMYIMPFFALSGLYWPFGLVLYWVTTNLWTLGQQWVLFRRYPQPAAAGGPAAAAGPAVTSGASARALTTTQRKRAAASPEDAAPASSPRDAVASRGAQGSPNGASRRGSDGGQVPST